MTEPDAFTKETAALAPLVGVAVDFAVDFAVSAIKQSLDQAKKNLTGTFLANGLVDDRILDGERCLVISRGLRGLLLENVAETSGRMSKQMLGPLGFADYPAFYLELKTAYNPASKSLTLTPVYLAYPESSALSAGSGKKNVTIGIAMHTKSGKAGEDPEKGALAVFRHNLGRIEIGTEMSELAQPGIFTGAAAAHTIGDKIGGNFVALVTEAEDPGIALNALSEAFGDGKPLGDALKKLIKDSVVPKS